MNREPCFHGIFLYRPDSVEQTEPEETFGNRYIFGLLKGWGMPDCMALATAAAGLKCRQVGGRAGIPNLAEIQELMGAEYPDHPG